MREGFFKEDFHGATSHIVRSLWRRRDRMKSESLILDCALLWDQDVWNIADTFTLLVNKEAFSSVQFSLSVLSASLRPHELQHARPPGPSPTPGVYSNSCPSSQWCHPTISSTVIPFSSCPQSLQHQGLFQWVNSLHEVAKVLEFQLQHQSFQWTPRTDLL